jgi:hypothetical protein
MRALQLGPLLLAACALMGAGCAPSLPTEETASSPVAVVTEVGETFDLRPGEEASIPEDDTRFRFDGVTEDSRCPIGVTCVWEGEVKVQVTVFYGDGTVHEAELSIPGGEPGPVAPERVGRAVAAGYVVHLLEVAPYPVAEDPPSDEPVATFRLERLYR